MGVHREGAIRPTRRPRLDECSTFACATKPVLLQGERDGHAEMIKDHGDVNVCRGEARPCEQTSSDEATAVVSLVVARGPLEPFRQLGVDRSSSLFRSGHPYGWLAQVN